MSQIIMVNSKKWFLTKICYIPHLNPIPTGGGGDICPPPPTRHTSSNISRTPCAADLKFSNNLNELIFKTKITFQLRLSTLGYHSKVQSWLMFLDNTFNTFNTFAVSCKRLPNSEFIAISIKSVRNRVCCGNFGLIFGMMASWWQFSFRTLFRASTTLNWAMLSPWHQEWFHLIWFFISFQKKLLLLTFNKGTRFWDSQSKIWNWIWIWTTLKRWSWFPWKPKFCQQNQSSVWRLIFGQAFRKILLIEWILRRVTGFLLGGGGGDTMCPLHAPPWFLKHKKAWLGQG